MFLSTEPHSGYTSHSPESNTVQRLAFYFFSSWIHEEQSLISRTEKYVLHQEKAVLSTNLPSNNKNKQTRNPMPRLPVTGAISLCFLFITLQGKALVVREEHLFMKTNLLMKAFISFYEVLTDTKAVWWGLSDRLFKLIDWWTDYWGV